MIEDRLREVIRLGGEIAYIKDLDLLMERTVGGWEQRWSSGFNSRADLIPSAAKMLIRKYRRRWFS